MHTFDTQKRFCDHKVALLEEGAKPISLMCFWALTLLPGQLIPCSAAEMPSFFTALVVEMEDRVRSLSDD